MTQESTQAVARRFHTPLVLPIDLLPGTILAHPAGPTIRGDIWNRRAMLVASN